MIDCSIFVGIYFLIRWPFVFKFGLTWGPLTHLPAKQQTLYLSHGVQWPTKLPSLQVAFKLPFWEALYFVWQPDKKLNGSNLKTFLGHACSAYSKSLPILQRIGFDTDEWHFWFQKKINRSHSVQ